MTFILYGLYHIKRRIPTDNPMLFKFLALKLTRANFDLIEIHTAILIFMTAICGMYLVIPCAQLNISISTTIYTYKNKMLYSTKTYCVLNYV